MEVLQRTANRGSVSTGPYQIGNSVKLEDGNNEWFYRASPTAGDRRTFTFSFWIKRTELGTINASGSAFVLGQGQHGRMYFGSDYFQFRFDDGHDVRDITRKHRDTSAWLHVVVAVDTNQSSSSNRVKIYFNGVQTTNIDHDGGSYPDIQDQSSGWFTTNYLTLGTAPFAGSYSAGDGDYDMSGYLAEFCAVDGQQLAPTNFGEFDSDSGIWKPIDVSGINFGSQGYYLDFADASDLGDDESGNGNDFTENNIAAADQAVDTPTNNFAIISDAMRDNHETLYSTLSDGGTLFRATEFDVWVTVASSIGVTKGKWYAEFKVIGARPNSFWGIISLEQLHNYVGSHLGEANESWGIGYYQANGKLYVVNNAGSSNTASWGSAVSQNAVVSVALDMDNHKLYMAVNNTYQDSGNPVTGANAISIDATETVAIATSGYSLGSGNDTIAGVNFGGYVTGGMYSQATDGNGYGAFRYAPPSGYYALCTKNLAEYG